MCLSLLKQIDALDSVYRWTASAIGWWPGIYWRAALQGNEGSPSIPAHCSLELALQLDSYAPFPLGWCQLFLGWCWGDTACIFWHKGPLLLETAHLELTVLPHSEHCSTLSFGLLLILEGPFVPVLLLGDSSPSPVLCKTLTKVTASLAFWDNTSPPRVHCWEPTSDFRAPLPDFSCFSHWCFPSLYNSWMLFIS